MKFETRILDTRLENLPLLPATKGSAGLDLRACVTDFVDIRPGEIVKIPTGLAVHIKDPNLMGLVFLRSSLGAAGLSLANGVGVIDSDYQGEISVLIANHHSYRVRVAALDRVAQLVVVPFLGFLPEVVSSFSESTARGTGGFGSTGTK